MRRALWVELKWLYNRKRQYFFVKIWFLWSPTKRDFVISSQRCLLYTHTHISEKKIVRSWFQIFVHTVIQWARAYILRWSPIGHFPSRIFFNNWNQEMLRHGKCGHFRTSGPMFLIVNGAVGTIFMSFHLSIIYKKCSPSHSHGLLSWLHNRGMPPWCWEGAKRQFLCIVVFSKYSLSLSLIKESYLQHTEMMLPAAWKKKHLKLLDSV